MCKRKSFDVEYSRTYQKDPKRVQSTSYETKHKRIQEHPNIPTFFPFQLLLGKLFLQISNILHQSLASRAILGTELTPARPQNLHFRFLLGVFQVQYGYIQSQMLNDSMYGLFTYIYPQNYPNVGDWICHTLSIWIWEMNNMYNYCIIHSYPFNGENFLIPTAL